MTLRKPSSWYLTSFFNLVESNQEKEPLLFEDTDGSIRAKKSRKSNSNASSDRSSDISPLFHDDAVPDQQQNVLSVDSSVPTLKSQAPTSRTSSSSYSSTWSKVSQEFEKIDSNCNPFILLPPPPPPPTPGKKVV